VAASAAVNVSASPGRRVTIAVCAPACAVTIAAAMRKAAEKPSGSPIASSSSGKSVMDSPSSAYCTGWIATRASSSNST